MPPQPSLTWIQWIEEDKSRILYLVSYYVLCPTAYKFDTGDLPRKVYYNVTTDQRNKVYLYMDCVSLTHGYMSSANEHKGKI